MKILEVTNVDFSLRQFLLPLMCGLKDRGHEVIGVCADGALLQDVREKGFRVIALPFARSYSPIKQWHAFWSLYHLIKTEKPDLVHGHMPISGLLARWAAFLNGTPYIAYTCHGYLFNQAGKGIKSWLRRLLSLFLEWGTGKITDYYMTVSKEEAQDAKRFFIHSHPIAVGNGRDPERFRPDITMRQQIRKQLQVSEDRIVILVVSRLVRHKGYPELLAAMAALKNAFPKIELWIVGKRLNSDHGQKLEACFQKAQNRLGDHLRFLGYRDDVNHLMAAADIFVLPSHFEGLPMSIIEAMLSGLPVISTTIRGPREQVFHQKTGLLVPPASAGSLAKALALMISNPQLRKKMGMAGREYALRHYTEHQAISRTMNALHL